MAIVSAILFSVSICLAPPTAAQSDSAETQSDDEGIPKFGGPGAVDATVEDDAKKGKPLFEFGFFQPYHDFKTHLAERGVSWFTDCACGWPCNA